MQAYNLTTLPRAPVRARARARERDRRLSRDRLSRDASEQRAGTPRRPRAGLGPGDNPGSPVSGRRAAVRGRLDHGGRPRPERRGGTRLPFRGGRPRDAPRVGLGYVNDAVLASSDSASWLRVLYVTSTPITVTGAARVLRRPGRPDDLDPRARRLSLPGYRVRRGGGVGRRGRLLVNLPLELLTDSAVPAVRAGRPAAVPGRFGRTSSSRSSASTRTAPTRSRTWP